jgi:AraC-like DNA-binding protein
MGTTLRWSFGLLFCIILLRRADFIGIYALLQIRYLSALKIFHMPNEIPFMARNETGNDPTLLISSAPLDWPGIEVERRFFRRDRVIDQPAGYPEHRIMIWDEPVSCTLVVGGKWFALDQFRSAVVVVPARCSFRATPKTPVHFTKLLMEEPFVGKVSRDALGVDTFTLEPNAVDGDQDLRAIAYLLTEAVTGHQPLDAEMIAVMARETAIHLVSNYSNQRQPRVDLAGRIPSSKLVQILDYIGANLDKPLPVAQLAQEAGLSKAHFSRAFAKSTGRSPHAYVTARRIAKAAHLLRNSFASIDQIAAQCGFHDQAHLTRLFKRAKGRTPGAFRTEGQ